MLLTRIPVLQVCSRRQETGCLIAFGWRIEGDFLAVLVGRWWMKHRLRVTKAPSVFGLTVLLSLEGECESEGSAAAWCWCKSHTAAESFGEGLGNGESQPGVALV